MRVYLGQFLNSPILGEFYVMTWLLSVSQLVRPGFHDGITLEKNIFFEKFFLHDAFLGMLGLIGRFGEASPIPSQVYLCNSKDSNSILKSDHRPTFQKGPLAKGKIKHIPPKEFRGFSPLAYHPPHPLPSPTSHLPSPPPPMGFSTLVKISEN